MKLLTVLITYQREELTRKTLMNYLSVTPHSQPHFLVVVDNNSTDGTKDYLKSVRAKGAIDLLILNPENYYPGKACNIGWEEGLKVYDATHLMRLDNDMMLKRGWLKRAEEYFQAIPELGQLGLDYGPVEGAPQQFYESNGFSISAWPGNVGGTHIMKRELWDKGLRYDETPWHHLGTAMPTPQEDVKLSFGVSRLGYLFGHMTERYGWTVADESNWSDYPEYYRKTMGERGYDFRISSKPKKS
jgi:glycosyltransferase involved in cell wall biosynthesis